MILGKTLQVISLLAALFEKTGSALDQKQLHLRRRVVDERKKERDDDLIACRNMLQRQRQGRLEYSEGDEELGLSSWVPVLVCVPPSVIDNWQREFETFGHFRYVLK